MSGSNRRSAPPPINLIEGFVMLSFKQSNLEYVSGNKSPLTSLRCFPSFKSGLHAMNTLIPRYMKNNTRQPTTYTFNKAWAPPSAGDLDCPARANPSNATNGECISLENQDSEQWKIVAGKPAKPCCFNGWELWENDIIFHRSKPSSSLCGVCGSSRYGYYPQGSRPWTPSGELQPVNNPPKYLPVMNSTKNVPHVTKALKNNYCINSFRFPAKISINRVTSDHL